MPVSVPTLRLHDGRAMPQLGFGVYQLAEADAPDIVGRAIGAGYRSIDTAAIYGNERGVGQAIREAGVGREDLFVTTKLWNDSQGSGAARRAFDESLTRLGLEHVDLYLIHWPCPERNLYLETWRALAALREEGRALSIGVSNFTVAQLERIIGETGIVPAINQIELHPRFQQAELRAFHEAHGIVTESWSPLGQGKELADPVLTRIAGAHRRTPAQIVLRWHLETGLVAIPKTATPARIAENIGVFDFALGEEDRRAIASLDRPDGRIGPNPDTFG
ncbi:aldo/keto reductase [Methylobacterium segetis]|uniref:aldo/keto reductase n=1 Tax=Methylobacterium segetis TaxID=2488750 RepID=UPI001044385A|nr:aldo/keto reductase [Methylobacterium segetis]